MAINFIWQVVIWIATTLISYALRPKPPGAQPAGLEDFTVPTADEGRPIPVVFGDVLVKSPNCVWYGDLYTTEDDDGVWIKYYMGMHLIVCHGPVDAVVEIQAGDRVAWTGNVTANSTITITEPDLFGGRHKEGGIKGDIDIMLGSASQTANSYLTSAQGATQPGYRGLTGLVLNQVYVTANTTYVKPWSIRVRRIPMSSWQASYATITTDEGITHQANPAHVIRECLTNSEWGMGYPTSAIDETTFAAAAHTLHTEKFGISIEWQREVTIEEFVQEIATYISGVVGVDPTTGSFTLRLLRDDYTVASLDTYTTNQIISLDSFERSAWSETINEMVVTYRDYDTAKDQTVTLQNLAALEIQSGQTVSQSAQYPGIYDPTLASRLAMRDLTAMSVPLAKVRFTAKRTWCRLIPEPLILRRLPWTPSRTHSACQMRPT